MQNDKKYEWVVVGGGAAGISIAEILSRSSKSVLLIEKNTTLASLTSKVFHEWFHSGSLYTLLPDRLKTTRYLLGSIDDMLEYYSHFNRMNLVPTGCGYIIKDKNKWFNNDHIRYQYNMRPMNFIWMLAVARAQWIIKEINNHDWLRQKAGSSHDGYRFNLFKILKNYPKSKQKFYEIISPDITINSRIMLQDIVSSYIQNGGNFELSCSVKNIIEEEDNIIVNTGNSKKINASKIVICAADGLKDLAPGIGQIKTSYAPMFVVENLPQGCNSFVELDYNPKNCINMIKKDNGIGLCGGVSVQNESEIEAYLNSCKKKISKKFPGLKILGDYVGLKQEMVFSGQNRNYQYHIKKITNRKWGVILGKFSSMFSLAPEFYRSVYYKNPPRAVPFDDKNISSSKDIISSTTWSEIYNRSIKEK
mgnify:CR=1 FL=1|tara:strand:+ start:1161 stop:2420 length:1260 start_codon:yes stop_codon:yes gene_type:complete